MDTIMKINSFVGVDWALERITVDDDRIQIDLLEERGYKATIGCNGFIGFAFIGHWDEGIIERVMIEPHGDLIDASLREIVRLHGDSHVFEKKGGNEKWYQLSIKLIDGSTVKVACTDFTWSLA